MRLKGKPVFIPSDRALRYACGVSGSGTNYDKIYEADPKKTHIVFSNAPDCSGVKKARERNAPVVTLDSDIYFKKMWGIEKVPRYGVERNSYDMAVMTLVEQGLKGEPDLICLAGYDQWVTDWMVDKYYPRMLNVHPGDTTKGYDGLHWIPTAKAILAGDQTIRSTLFIVDKGEDTGPVLVQSAPLDIKSTLKHLESQGEKGLLNYLEIVTQFIVANRINDYHDFQSKAGIELSSTIAQVSSRLQDKLKVNGDWKIYPFAVHDLIGKGRAAIEGRNIFIDGNMIPVYGHRLDK